MITAKEAQKTADSKTLKSVETRSNEILDNIETHIREESNMGRYEYWFYPNQEITAITEEIKNDILLRIESELLKADYILYRSTNKANMLDHNYIWKISWKKP